MTPKEKAEELVHNYYSSIMDIDFDDARHCALIAVDEILNSNPRYPNNVDWDDADGTYAYYYEAQFEEAEKYWEQVKQEIEKLC